MYNNLAFENCRTSLAMHAAYLESLPEDQKQFLGFFLGTGCNFKVTGNRFHRSSEQCKMLAGAFYKDEVKFMRTFDPTDELLTAVSKWSVEGDEMTEEEFSRIAHVSLTTAIAWFSSVQYCEEDCRAGASATPRLKAGACNDKP